MHVFVLKKLTKETRSPFAVDDNSNFEAKNNSKHGILLWED